MNVWFRLAVVLMWAGLSACNKSNNNMSKIPVISFLSVAPDYLIQGNPADTAWISFRFEDGDADINTSGRQANIVLKDMRTDQLLNFTFPAIPDYFKDPIKGMKGSCLIGIAGSILQFRDTLNNRERDTVVYEIYILDEANNQSNVITTSPLFIGKQ